MEELGRLYYLMALSAAKRGDLSAAARLAQRARMLQPPGGSQPGDAANGAVVGDGVSDGQANDASEDSAAGADASDSWHTRAGRLLGLCLLELGDTENAAKILSEHPDLAQGAQEAHEQTKAGLEQLAKHAQMGQWRAALKAAEDVPHQSVRMLNIRGCILAGAKRYGRASKLFALAQQKDRGQDIAQEYLWEATGRRSFWGL